MLALALTLAVSACESLPRLRPHQVSGTRVVCILASCKVDTCSPPPVNADTSEP
jgi:hypothetical protein